MADDLKRVGLKFTAEGAEDFKSALKSVSASTKENYSELKLAQSQYDKNTSSTEKLEDRQKYLASQTEDYKKKLGILNTQLAEMENAENKDEAAIAEKRAEINQTTAKLNEYQDSLEKVNKALENHVGDIKDMGAKLTDMGGKVEGVGKALSVGVTAPVTAAAAASVSAWHEVDEAMDTVTTKTGASGAALEDMQNRAKSIAETIPVSFQDAGTAIGEVNTRFGVTGDQLEGLSKQFLEFAQINGTDVNSSIDSVQKALSAFGLSADDAGNMLDTLNVVGQNTGISVDTLAQEMTANGAAMREMGFSASDAANLLGTLEKSGINTSDVMTGLKKAMAESQSTGESMGDVLQRAFSSAGDASDVFGAKAGPALYNAMQSGILSMDMFVAGTTDLTDAAGSVSDTFEQTLDPLDQTQVAMNNLKDVGAQLVDAAAPLITDVLGALTDGIKNLKGMLDSMPEGTQQAIVQFALIAAAVGPVVLGIGKLMTGVGGLVTKFAGALESAGSFGGALTSLAGGPVGLIIGAIAAVAAALVALYINNEDFRNFVNEAWTNIQSVIGTVIDAIKGFWESTLQPVFQAIGDFCQNILWPIIQLVFMSISEVVGAVFQVIKGYWGNILQPVFSAIGSFLQGTVWPIVQTVFNAIRSVVSTVFNAIKAVWDSVLHPVFRAIGDAVQAMANVISPILDGIKGSFERVFNGIKNFLSPIISWLKGIFNFHWSLPGIKLPHFRITGKFSLKDLTVPHISVDWYAKAMSRGMILNGATIFGASGGSLLGGGEAGPEAVVGVSSLDRMIQQSVMQASEQSISYGGITINVYGAQGQSVKELADEIENRINDRMRRRQKVFE